MIAIDHAIGTGAEGLDRAHEIATVVAVAHATVIIAMIGTRDAIGKETIESDDIAIEWSTQRANSMRCARGSLSRDFLPASMANYGFS
ncbi:unnamed protein product [Cylicostephanus goldi]|uniref:Uncharacterized protein n=1 Tax=Cylicostephanus goldi TaxID=71465 RepID=A0A3P6RCF1_CYLGO|nr:unnamed protein product [Cylicostephanus goldi]